MAKLSNTGGTLTLFHMIGYEEEQGFEVAVRDVPCGNPKIDTSNFVISAKEIRIKARFSNAEKSTLTDIVDANAETALILTIGWSYNVWIKNKNLKWTYIKDTFEERPWETDLILAVIFSSGYNKISNSSFENEFTDWTIGGDPPPIISDEYYHSGTHSANFSDNMGDPDTMYIEQAIDNVPVANVSEFYLWKYGRHEFSPPAGSQTEITIYYTDSSTTIVNHTTDLAHGGIWEQIDLVPYLDAGKTINKIRIRRSDDYGGYYQYIDDVTLI